MKTLSFLLLFWVAGAAAQGRRMLQSGSPAAYGGKSVGSPPKSASLPSSPPKGKVPTKLPAAAPTRKPTAPPPSKPTAVKPAAVAAAARLPPLAPQPPLGAQPLKVPAKTPPAPAAKPTPGKPATPPPGKNATSVAAPAPAPAPNKAAGPTARQIPVSEADPNSGQQCPMPQAVTMPAPGEEPKQFIFNEMSTKEVLSTQAYVSAALNLWSLHNGSAAPNPNQDFVVQMELIPPTKAEALAHIDGDSPAPPRFAQVTVIRGSKSDCMDYKVGPLDQITTNANTSQLITPMTRPGQVPWVKRPRSDAGGTWLGEFLSPTSWALRDIFRNFTGAPGCFGAPAAGTPNPDPCTANAAFGLLPYPALSSNASQRLTIIKFFLTALGGDESNLFSIPLTVQVDESATNLSEWTVSNFVYCNQGPFDSAAALLKAFRGGQLERCNSPGWGQAGFNFLPYTTVPFTPPPANNSYTPANNPTLAAGLQQIDLGSPWRPGVPKASARSYAPEGSRVTVTPSSTSTGTYFQWLEWSGHVTVRGTSGLALHDLRFRGNRIVYELALQELFIAYSGYGGIGQNYFLDSYYGLGIDALPLKVGSDCPDHAIYVDVASVLDTTTVGSEPDALCIFEDDLSATAWRHSNTGGPNGLHLDSVRGVELAVRMISTIGNYDYIMTVTFKLDGSIGVEVQAGGYMETVYWQYPQTGGDLPFGTVVGRNILANLHDHLAGWKVDLDVLGQNNTFTKQVVKVGSYAEALAAGGGGRPGQSVRGAGVAAKEPGWYADAGGPDVVKYIETTAPGKEVGMQYNLSAPSVWQFAAGDGQNTVNSWGQPRAYAIVPTGWQTTQLLPPTHPLLQAEAWTKYHLAVTQRKDSEPRSVASRFDFYIPQKPVVSLDHFIDGESTDNVDLVGWVMAGVQHIPRSEDVPVVSNFGSSFAIRPWNMFNELASRIEYDDPSPKGCSAPIFGLNLPWPPPPPPGS